MNKQEVLDKLVELQYHVNNPIARQTINTILDFLANSVIFNRQDFEKYIKANLMLGHVGNDYFPEKNKTTFKFTAEEKFVLMDNEVIGFGMEEAENQVAHIMAYNLTHKLENLIK